jgi:AcrR family transcriptional regulator
VVQIAAARPPRPATAAPRLSRADLTRRRILEAASRVFRSKGLQATGMRDIAAELGMHVGNLYYYFRDKSELLAFCQEATLDRLLALGARVEADDVPADAKLRRLVSGHVVELNEEVPGTLLHLEIEAIDAVRRPAILARRDAYEETWERVIEQGIAVGVLREVDPAITARALLGAVNWTVKWYRADGERTAREIGDAFADVLIAGLLESSQPGPRRSGALPSPRRSGATGRSSRAGSPRAKAPRAKAPRAKAQPPAPGKRKR